MVQPSEHVGSTPIGLYVYVPPSGQTTTPFLIKRLTLARASGVSQGTPFVQALARAACSLDASIMRRLLMQIGVVEVGLLCGRSPQDEHASAITTGINRFIFSCERLAHLPSEGAPSEGNGAATCSTVPVVVDSRYASILSAIVKASRGGNRIHVLFPRRQSDMISRR